MKRVDDYPKFKKAYKKAVEEQQETFMYEGQEILTDYAKYFIEFYDDKFKTKN